MQWLIFTLFLLAHANSKMPMIETYWEAWTMEHSTDFASSLKTIPIASPGTVGVNIIDISFCNYHFGEDDQGRITLGYINELKTPDETLYTVDELIADVKAVHKKGGLVKLSFGGATFSMATGVADVGSAAEFAQNVKKAVEQFDFDGIDFDVEDATSGDIQIAVIKECRKALGPNKLISYTLPGTGELHSPYSTVLSETHEDIDAVNVMAYDVYWTGYDPLTDFKDIEALGVAKEKIVWGVMPGCHDASNEFTTVDDAKSAAQQVAQLGLYGVMMWDINRDTNHRSQSGCLYETGLPDGTYVTAVAQGMSEAVSEME